MSKTIKVQAAQAPKPLDITASFAVAAADAETRVISGEIVRYGVVGNTSFGRTKFLPGSVSVPQETSRSKLLEMHDMERSVGFMLDYGDEETRMTGRWKVADTEQGTQALQAAINKTRDALSLGVEVIEYYFEDDGTLVVQSSILNETSLVTIPAFSESRVDHVAAHRKENHEMPKALTTPATELPAPDAEKAAPPVVQAGQVEQAVQPIVNAGNPVTPVNAADGFSLSQVAMKIAAAGGVSEINSVMAGINPPLMVTAALTDVVPADDAGLSTTATRPQWEGELWQARRVARPTIDSVTQKPLTSMKGYGYTKVYPKPTDTPAHFMNEYEGNKKPVPASAKIKTAATNWTAMRMAGGWDVDRAYFDFNDQEFIEVTLQAAQDDYLAQSEAWLVEKMLAAAVGLTAADVLQGLTAVGAAAANLGSQITKIQFGSAMWEQFISLTSAEAPWWLRNQGEINLGTVDGNAGSLSFNVNPELAPTEMLAHDRRAVTFRESKNINVRAENIPNGGVDLGVFKYLSHSINDSRAIFKTAAAEVPAG